MIKKRTEAKRKEVFSETVNPTPFKYLDADVEEDEIDNKISAMAEIRARE